MQILQDLQTNQDLFVEPFYQKASNHYLQGHALFRQVFKGILNQYNEFHSMQAQIESFLETQVQKNHAQKYSYRDLIRALETWVYQQSVSQSKEVSKFQLFLHKQHQLVN